MTSAAPALRRFADLRKDAVAGLSVMAMGVPQAMAYAIIADLPPIYGLYTAMVTCAVAALFGSSSHLVTGPTNSSCMVLLSLITHLHGRYPADPFELVLLVTFMAGAIQLTFGVLRLGGVVRYVSNSVVVGFTAGAGILIIVNQARNLLGLDLSAESPRRFYEVLAATFRHLPETNLRALAVGVVTAVLVLALPRLHRRLPGPLLGVTLAAIAVFLLGWHEPGLGAARLEIARDMQPIEGSLLEMFRVPALIRSPDLAVAHDLGAGALALAILTLVEASSIARSAASRTGQRLDFNRLFRAQGIANLTGSFFSCFIGSGSFTRTAVNVAAGARTRLAAIFSATFTALTVVLLGPLVDFIPKAALAGLLMVVAYGMVEKNRLRLAFVSSSQSRVSLFGTLAATLVLPLEYAIFTGVFLSVVLLLRVTGKPDLTQLVPRPDSGFEEVPFNKAAPSEVVTVNLEGDFYFAAVENLEYELLRCLTGRTRVVVLRMKRLRAVGSTAMAILDHFDRILRERGIHLVVSGVEDELKQVLTNSGLRAQLGEQNIFYADNRLFQSTELAHARAWSIVRAEKRRAAESAGEAAPDGDAAERPENLCVTARDLMSPRCIRFGDRHQLREAMWLMSEMLRHSESSTVQPLFLQDKEGRLFGELTIYRQMEKLLEGIESTALLGVRDKDLGALFRIHLTVTIGALAKKDLEPMGPETPLAQLLHASVENDLAVLPIVDADRRIVGLVDQADLLAGVGIALGVSPAESPAPPAPGAGTREAQDHG